MIIGLSGYARSGKDTVAAILAEDGWERRAFADPLREMLLRLNPIADGELRVQDLVSLYGWDDAKTLYPEIRELLQRLGTEAGREILGDDIWVKTTLSTMSGGKYVITDCRFPNEADAIRAAGGQVWRIHRPGFGPVNAHATENSMESYKFDAHIHNDGDLYDLTVLVNSVVAAL